MYYAHMNIFDDNIKEGESVAAGDILGTIGDTLGCEKNCDDTEGYCGIKEKTLPYPGKSSSPRVFVIAVTAGAGESVHGGAMIDIRG